MPSLSFQRMLAPPIVAKTKQHSIRGWSAKKFPYGSILYMFTGMRTVHCQRFGQAVTQEVRPILIEPRGAVFFPTQVESIVDDGGLNAFAVADGFKDWNDLQRFWHKHHRGVHCFDGRMIIWGETFQPAAII